MLRSAGLPVATLHALRIQRPTHATQCSEAAQDADELFIARVAQIFRETPVGEALAWQNPRIWKNNLATLEPINNSKNRRRAAALFAYISRYVARNDTIGFFGSLCWGTVDQSMHTSFVADEPTLKQREVYFESWTVDELARVLASVLGIFPYLPLIAHGTSPRHAPRHQHDPNGLETRILELQGEFDTIGELACHLREETGDDFEEVALAIARLV
ncbi:MULTISPECIES: lantibiotic dehydratase [Actinomyces]|uniref:Lantibiotic dehydratase n=1 Tax=Actinomyces respiraculi TaxID=2744574 RepID=A0A7T0LJU1_9ACTO|nr:MULTISPECIES: lantibiotic dehydratase [Actinomyces]QPL04458.1 lantibiotic dehydratase [Actinomyces respiraculi]